MTGELKQPSKIQTAKQRRCVVIFIIDVKERQDHREADLVTATEKQLRVDRWTKARLSCSRTCCYLRANKSLSLISWSGLMVVT